MAHFWTLILIFSTMYQARKYQVTANSPKQPEVPKELSVNIGESATLQCCVSNNQQDGRIIWLKQRPNQTRPEVVAGTFTSEFQSSRLQIKKDGNCYNLTIFNTTKSDNSIYYSALMYTNKTSLKIKGPNVSPREKTTELPCTQQKTVFALGAALGLCVVLNFCLMFILLRRRECNQNNASVEDSPGTKKESEEETLNYAAVNFSKTKAEAENKHIGSTECVYSSVK